MEILFHSFGYFHRFYSIADVKEIVMFASERRIAILPEIDVPGHCLAVIKTFPSLAPVFSGQIATKESAQGYQNNILSAVSEDVYSF